MKHAPDAANWAEIERLLDAALDQPLDARGEYVRANASTREIADVVLDLLDRQSKLGAFLESRPALGAHLFEAASSQSVPMHALKVGDIVGVWRLVRELGHGGMAVVWLAARADGAWSQQVALKFVRPGLDSALLRERFGREQRILARLQHPRIARLLDGGIDNDRPYLALEFVEGIAITEWCAQQSASIRLRLRLLRQVCDAVAFAHARLIVHRDIKPSNILVDAAGDVHLLDFGIAKILAGEDAAFSTSLTAIGGRAMTPSYAAPEQIDGRPLSVATDVYSLGVLLYELLCGHLPYRPAHAGSAALEDAVLHQEAMLASRAADADQARRCRTSLHRLRRELRGDIDRILATALEKDPDRRYASVEAFAQDIDRHLDGRPIRARRASIGYRTGKFVRRHALGLAVGAALVIAILCGIAGTLWQAKIAEAAAHRAHEEAAEATAVRDLLTGLFQRADPDIALGRDPTASELLDAGARRARSELADRPVLKARLLGVIADLFLKLGHYRESSELYAQAIESTGSSSPSSALDRLQLRLGHAQASTLSGELKAAETELAELDSELADMSGANSQLLRTRVQVEQGEVLRRQGHFAEARAKLDGALAFFTGPATPSDAYLTALQRSADLEFSSGHFENAERQFRDLLALLVARHGEEHTEVARAHHDMGVTLGQLGRLEEAERSLTRALELRRRLLGENHPAVAYSHANIAAVLRLRQRLDDAQTHYLSSLEINRSVFGEDSAEVARDYNGLAALAASRRDFAKARDLFAKSFAGYAKVLGASHPDVGMALMNQAIMERRLGRFADAHENLLRSMSIFATTLPDDHYLIALARYGLGMVSLANGDGREATEYLRRSVPVMEQSMGAGHVDVARAKAAWSLALAMNGDRAQAVRVANEISLPTSDPRARADVAYLRGRAQQIAGGAGACSDLDEAWQNRARLDGESDPAAVEAELYLGACLHADDEKRARERIRHAAPIVIASAATGPSVQRDAVRLLRGQYDE